MKKSLAMACVLAFATSAGAAGSKTDKQQTTENRPIGMGSEASPADNKMAQQIRDELKRDTTLSTQAQNVSVSAAEGEIRITGVVSNESERNKVESVARRVAGDNRVLLDIAVQ